MILEDYVARVYLPAHLNRSPRTLADYATICRTMRRFAGRPVLLSDLSDAFVESYLAWLGSANESDTIQRRPASPATQNRHRAVILALWRYARRSKVRMMLAERAPATDPDVEKLHTPRRIPEAWSQVELSALLQTASRRPGRVGHVAAGDFWPALICTAYVTAWRIGAIMRLEPADLESFGEPLDGRYPGQLRSPAESQKHFADEVALVDHATFALLSRLQPGRHSRLFPWDATVKTLREHFRGIVADSGLRTRKYLFHKLRASHASLLESRGGDATTSLGHSSRRVTLASYLDPRLSRRPAVELLPPIAILS